uniref:PB1 domain-containing protein n=1 Tax=Chromera velia CCMP2878 TaxID=1169474 RepID=A0A0K6S961_9ALVE|eukprot:Cvel_1163.t2-p1 / transcript=Cvel_1163.t2 / gene=Cvel_1163 / organism=Chromera_velia_CCMP2878 / gene_product=Ensconsin, putative / transcript_product=Ensconsin, putative / location=Cvel_scaffold38:131655-136620(-) / protein_length=852 / sequence_SO=supercontig / SO=protein_coding / is_pseudo=false
MSSGDAGIVAFKVKVGDRIVRFPCFPETIEEVKEFIREKTGGKTGEIKLQVEEEQQTIAIETDEDLWNHIQRRKETASCFVRLDAIQETTDQEDSSFVLLDRVGSQKEQEEDLQSEASVNLKRSDADGNENEAVLVDLDETEGPSASMVIVPESTETKKEEETKEKTSETAPGMLVKPKGDEAEEEEEEEEEEEKENAEEEKEVFLLGVNSHLRAQPSLQSFPIQIGGLGSFYFKLSFLVLVISAGVSLRSVVKHSGARQAPPATRDQRPKTPAGDHRGSRGPFLNCSAHSQAGGGPLCGCNGRPAQPAGDTQTPPSAMPSEDPTPSPQPTATVRDGKRSEVSPWLYYGLDAEDNPIEINSRTGEIKLMWPELKNEKAERERKLQEKEASLATERAQWEKSVASERAALSKEKKEVDSERAGVAKERMKLKEESKRWQREESLWREEKKHWEEERARREKEAASQSSLFRSAGGLAWKVPDFERRLRQTASSPFVVSTKSNAGPLRDLEMSVQRKGTISEVPKERRGTRTNSEVLELSIGLRGREVSSAVVDVRIGRLTFCRLPLRPSSSSSASKDIRVLFSPLQAAWGTNGPVTDRELTFGLADQGALEVSQRQGLQCCAASSSSSSSGKHGSDQGMGTRKSSEKQRQGEHKEKREKGRAQEKKERKGDWKRGGRRGFGKEGQGEARWRQAWSKLVDTLTKDCLMGLYDHARGVWRSPQAAACSEKVSKSVGGAWARLTEEWFGEETGDGETEDAFREDEDGDLDESRRDDFCVEAREEAVLWVRKENVGDIARQQREREREARRGPTGPMPKMPSSRDLVVQLRIREVEGMSLEAWQTVHLLTPPVVLIE